MHFYSVKLEAPSRWSHSLKSTLIIPTTLKHTKFKQIIREKEIKYTTPITRALRASHTTTSHNFGSLQSLK
jgi:hypothetical protein